MTLSFMEAKAVGCRPKVFMWKSFDITCQGTFHGVKDGVKNWNIWRDEMNDKESEVRDVHVGINVGKRFSDTKQAF